MIHNKTGKGLSVANVVYPSPFVFYFSVVESESFMITISTVGNTAIAASRNTDTIGSVHSSGPYSRNTSQKHWPCTTNKLNIIKTKIRCRDEFTTNWKIVEFKKKKPYDASLAQNR